MDMIIFIVHPHHNNLQLLHAYIIATSAQMYYVYYTNRIDITAGWISCDDKINGRDSILL